MPVHYRDTALPILREADVAVVGGSFAGVAAALAPQTVSARHAHP